MAKKENIEANAEFINGEANVKKESKIKNAFSKVTHFVAGNRGKIMLAVGLIAGSVGGVAIANAISNRDCEDEYVEMECEMLDSEESSEET